MGGAAREAGFLGVGSGFRLSLRLIRLPYETFLDSAQTEHPLALPPRLRDFQPSNSSGYKLSLRNSTNTPARHFSDQYSWVNPAQHQLRTFCYTPWMGP